MHLMSLVLLLIVAGCGGGGGPTSIPTPEPPVPKPLVVLEKINEIQAVASADDDMVGNLLRLVGHRPDELRSRSLGAASISQYSGGDGGISDRRFLFVVEDEADTPKFLARRYHDTGRVLAEFTSTDPHVSSNRLDDYPNPGWIGVEMEAEDTHSTSYISIFSDIENNTATDYLAMGYWLAERNTPTTDGSNYNIGIAAGGNDPFERDHVLGLVGEATYTGTATGLHMKKDSAEAAPVFDHFNATATLTAYFGDASEHGTVHGEITDGRTTEGYSIPTLILGSAPLTPDGREFYGETTGSGGWAGEWGGKFYNNGASATDHPGATAGTFGAKTADELEGLAGAFAARR